MFKLVLFVVVLLCVNINVIAFKNNRLFSTRFVSKINSGEPSEVPAEEPKPELFSMNKRVRLGRSKDEDGKSNIWSIEPTMQVEEDDEESGSGSKKNIFIGGAVFAAAIASLPLFNAFSSLFPDPSDF
jgi:hypothetical protein